MGWVSNLGIMEHVTYNMEQGGVILFIILANIKHKHAKYLTNLDKYAILTIIK